MIFIIGTDRYFLVSTAPRRKGAGKEGLAKFHRYLNGAANRRAAGLIAEEASEEWVSEQGPDAWSIAQRVCRQMNIRHRFCDPDAEERRALALKTDGELWDKANVIAMQTGSDIVAIWKEEVRNSLQVRQDFWLRRLKVRGFKKMTILFVCEADHAAPFRATLLAKGLEVSLLCRDWPNDMSGD